jgi:hypothetical protein
MYTYRVRAISIREREKKSGVKRDVDGQEEEQEKHVSFLIIK